MATRRFNPKTGRYEDVVSSKGFRLPQLSLPKFSLFQTDRQIKDLAQSSRKAKQRSTDPAHKRVEKLKAENITRNIAEAESIVRSAVETGTARARAEAVKAVAKLAEAKAQAESELERLTPTETVTVNDDEHEPLGLPAPKDSFELTSQPLQEESKGDFFFDFPLKDEDKSGTSSGNKGQFKKMAMLAGIILVLLFSLSIVFDQPYTNSYVNKSRSSVPNTSKKYSPTGIPEVSTPGMSGESMTTDAELACCKGQLRVCRENRVLRAALPLQRLPKRRQHNRSIGPYIPRNGRRKNGKRTKRNTEKRLKKLLNSI